jgi:hypothetical protein
MAAQSIWKNTPSTFPHEYLRDTLSFRYQECKSCRNRTELTCIKCGFCYSCHWKKEELEKKEKEEEIQSKPLITKVKYSYSSTPSSSTKTMMTMTTQSRESVLMQQQQQQSESSKVIDVFGQESEPICNYYRCHHKFSLHSLNSHNTCHCKHPKNDTIGISKSIHER